MSNNFYCVVHAEFPNISDTDRKTIYKCLEDKNWEKVENIEDRSISTVWIYYGEYKKDDSIDKIYEEAKKDFLDCSNNYTDPKLVITVSEDKPLIYE